jgi:hypothetical protein
MPAATQPARATTKPRTSGLAPHAMPPGPARVAVLLPPAHRGEARCGRHVALVPALGPLARVKPFVRTPGRRSVVAARTA